MFHRPVSLHAACSRVNNSVDNFSSVVIRNLLSSTASVIIRVDNFRETGETRGTMKLQLELNDMPARSPRMYNMKEWKLVALKEYNQRSAFLADTPAAVAQYYHEYVTQSPLFTSETENFWTYHLNTRSRIIGINLVAHGTLDTLLVHPREVFRPACVGNAAAVVLLHNHPSGDPSPSEADIKVTRDLIRAGQMLKIEVLDHVIIGQATTESPVGYVSLRELGYFCV